MEWGIPSKHPNKVIVALELAANSLGARFVQQFLAITSKDRFVE
jgi:hypothetical protein